MYNLCLQKFLFIFIGTLLIWKCNSTRNGDKLYEVRIRSNQEREFINSLRSKTGYEVFSLPKALNETCKVAVDFERQKEIEESLAKRFMPYKVLFLDLESFLRTIRPDVSGRPLALKRIDFKQFYKTSDLHFYLDYLKSQYPKQVHVSSLGRSTEGRPLKAVKISTGEKKNKNAIIIAAGIHGREWIAPAAALYTIYQLVENQSENRKIVSSYEWVILPVINPDGYDYSLTKDQLWRKSRSHHGNCTGTDIDRNFSFEWKGNKSSSDPCNQHYRGPEPFSEPETRALHDIFEKYRGRAKVYIALHAEGRKICHPWAYKRERPETESQLQKIAVAGSKAIYEESGQDWPITSQAQANEEANGASIDYAYEVERIPFVFRLELEAGGFTGYDPNGTEIEPMVHRCWTGLKAMIKELSIIPKSWLDTYSAATFSFSIMFKNLLFSQIYPMLFTNSFSENFI